MPYKDDNDKPLSRIKSKHILFVFFFVSLFSLIIYLRHWYLSTTATHIKSSCFPFSIQDSQTEKPMKISVVFAFAFVAMCVLECCVSGTKLIIFIYNKLDSIAAKSSLWHPFRCVDWKATSVTAAEFNGFVIPSNLYVPVNFSCRWFITHSPLTVCFLVDMWKHLRVFMSHNWAGFDWTFHFQILF